MRGLLVVGGLDPSGGAGITLDVQHAADLGVWALPVAATLTVQDPGRFDAAEPVPARTFTASLEAAIRTAPVGAVKTGYLGTASQVEYLAAFLSSIRQDSPDLPIVVDPVLRATAATADDPDAADAGDDAEALRFAVESKLLPLASLVSANPAELAALSGQPVSDLDSAKAAAGFLIGHGLEAVHVKSAETNAHSVVDLIVTKEDAQFVRLPRVNPDEVHGTGCAVATRAAAHRMLGRAWPESCALAALEVVGLRATARFGRPGAPQALLSPFPLAADDDGSPAVQAVEAAVPRLLSLLPPTWVAECGNNLAYLPAGATDAHGAATLRQRIRLRDGRPHTPAAAHHAHSSHVARVALAANQDGSGAAALNLRADPLVETAAETAGLTIGRFSRADEPPDAPSSVEWGTGKVFALQAVDLVADDGGPGKEPMIRLLARDPQELIDKLERLVVAAQQASGVAPAGT